MALAARHNTLGRVPTEVPRGAPVESAQLAALGVSVALATVNLRARAGERPSPPHGALSRTDPFTNWNPNYWKADGGGEEFPN